MAGEWSGAGKDAILFVELKLAGYNINAPLGAAQILMLQPFIEREIGKKGMCVLANWMGGAEEGSKFRTWMGKGATWGLPALAVIATITAGQAAGTINVLCPNAPSVKDSLATLRQKSDFLADIVEGLGKEWQDHAEKSRLKQLKKDMANTPKIVGKAAGQLVKGTVGGAIEGAADGLGVANWPWGKITIGLAVAGVVVAGVALAPYALPYLAGRALK